jgi:localization factor PodJL
MKTGVPWNVKGLRPEARETAREAARRAGMSVSDWINSIIIDQAGEKDHRPDQRPAFDDETSDPRAHLVSVNERLAQLTQQLDRLTLRQEPPPPRLPEPEAGPRLADAIARLDRRLDQMVTEGRSASTEIERRVTEVDRAVSAIAREPARGFEPAPPDQEWTTDIDRAVAEIAARQRALDVNGPASLAPQPKSRPATLPADPADPLAPFRPRAHAPAAPYEPAYQNGASDPHTASHQRAAPSRQPASYRQDASYQQAAPAPDLTGIEEQLRQLTAQIGTLRQPWEDAVASLRGDLAEIARTLTDAMPRHAVEAIESEIRGLAERVADTRQCGADAGALANIERGLAELRDELRALTPAESLVGIDEAIRALSRKIDLVSTSSQDPAALQHLESAIDALRGIMAHVASDEALSQLAGEVRELSAKVDRIAEAASSTVISGLERRISMLADAMAGRNEDGATAQLEGMLKSLGDKLERLQLTRGDQAALGSLEDRIVMLVERLDASGPRLGHLESIERALAELLVRLEGQRVGAPRGHEGSGDSETLRQGLAEFERRTQDTLEAVQGTLGHVVDRLVMIETDMRAGHVNAHANAVRAVDPRSEPPPPPMPPAATISRPSSPSAAAPAPPPTRVPPPAITPRGPAPLARAPIDPSLPPDHPLEPGHAPGRGRGASPGERIAASEAALAGAKPPVIPDPGGKSNFIAAARRAAQAAAAQMPPVAVKLEQAPLTATPGASSALTGRVRSLLVTTSVIVIVLGTLHLGANMLGLYDPAPEAPRPAASETRPQPAPERRQPSVSEPEQAKPTSNSTDRRSGVLPGVEMPGLSAPAAGVMTPDDKPPQTPTQSGALPAPSAVTGSLATPLPPAAVAGAPADKLPASIGGPALRAAAISGDATAAYEIGVRYADGRGVTQSFEEAARWFERAANEGIAPALFRLGGFYEKGIGVKRDLQAARRHYVAAAEKGHGKAMHNLAVLHAEGVDGRPDYKIAVQWFRKAAGHGISDSQYNLGVLYARGIGVEQNLPESYKWFALAALQGDQDSGKKRDDIAARMDAQALAAAKLATQTFKPEPQPEAATMVATPPGGWDRTAAAAAKARTAAR